MKSFLASAPFLFFAMLLSSPARADITPPEAESCVGKAAGDACVYNGAGACQDQTCTGIDYAHWDHDASSQPPSTTYACLKCVADDSACSIGKQATARRVAPWLLAGAFSLLFVVARRRRQS